MAQAVAAAALTLLLAGPAAAADWPDAVRSELARIESREGGRLALHVEDLATGETFSWRAEDTSYLASGVKIPIAVTILKQVDEGSLKLDDVIRFDRADLIDASPALARLHGGELLTVRELLEHAIVESDNTAADLLLRRADLAAVNRCVSSLVPEGFGEITSLADVRRACCAEIHPGARRLTNEQIRELQGLRDETARLKRLHEMLGEPSGRDDCALSFAEAYDRYYGSGLNSATLSAYGVLLSRIATGRALSPESSRLLLEIMLRTTTGANRIRAGLPEGLAWAHKTGTQRERVGDFGIAWRQDQPERRWVIAAVASGFRSTARGERALRQAAEALAREGVFERRPEPTP